MFDLSFSEIIIIAIVALVVIKPEDLPGAMKAVGKGFRKLKSLAHEFTGLFDEVKEPVKKELTEIIDLDGNVQKAYDVSELPDLIDEKDRK